MWLLCRGAVYGNVWVMRVGGGVLALLFPVTSDAWRALGCACGLVLPEAGFRSWGGPVGSSRFLWGLPCVACF